MLHRVFAITMNDSSYSVDMYGGNTTISVNIGEESQEKVCCCSYQMIAIMYYQYFHCIENQGSS